MKRVVAIGVVLAVWFALGYAVAARDAEPAPKASVAASDGCACCGGKSGDVPKDQETHAEDQCPHH